MNKNSSLISQDATIENQVINVDGEDLKVKVITVSSVFPHERQMFFQQEMIIANTLKITKPFAKIKFLNGENHKEWKEGYTYQMKVKSFGIFAIGGTHYISVDKIDPKLCQIVTTEHNQIAPIWNHTLSFINEGTSTTRYEDQIILKTKFLNGIFARYLVLFYKRRHKNWNKILNKISQT